MPAKRPQRRIPEYNEDAPTTLMGNQDTKHKGDSRGNEKVMVSFLLPASRRDELKAYAQAHGMSQSRVIVEGLNWRLKQE